MFNPKLYFVKKLIKTFQRKAQWENIPRSRAGFEKLTNRTDTHHPDVHYETISIDDMSAEWIVPKKVNNTKVLLYFHGGGYAVGSPNTHRALVSQIAIEGNLRALVIDYRLAPEHTYPAAIEDATKAYQWLLQKYKPSEIAFGGDSAGGGITLGTLVFLRDNAIPLPKCAIALSPWTDLTLSGTSYEKNKEVEVMLLPQAFPLWIKNYLGEAAATSPYASPLFADLQGLPPLYIQVGGDEILLDDSVTFATKAKAAGVLVMIDIYSGYFHVFQSFWKFLSKARKANKQLGQFLNTQLSQ